MNSCYDIAENKTCTAKQKEVKDKGQVVFQDVPTPHVLGLESLMPGFKNAACIRNRFAEACFPMLRMYSKFGNYPLV